MKLRVAIGSYALIWPVTDLSITVGMLTDQITRTVGLDEPDAPPRRRFAFVAGYQLPASAPVSLVLKDNVKIQLLHKDEYSGQILEVLKDEPWTTTTTTNSSNMAMESASIPPAVPPGAGLKRTQSRNARRKVARQHKQAKQEQLDQPQVRSDDDESDNDDKEDDKNTSNSTSDSSCDDSSDDSSDNSSDSSDSSSSSSDDDAPPIETFNVTHKRPRLYYDATTQQPYRVYRGRLELETAEIDLPGTFALRVPVPSATTPFTHESIAAGTCHHRPHEPRVAFARPFNTTRLLLVPTQLAKLQRGQVVRFGMLAIKPGEMVPSFEPNLCALVLAGQADNNGHGDDNKTVVTVQLASQFISLEPAANRFTPAPPRYDYGVRELTAASGVSDLHVYEGVPPLAIYPSMLFEAELNDDQ
ncbi:hypothetical protein D0Z00_003741 [Geotrichum galactomycetum]|uniref:Uncharacterized protein n=1 Tax=Geotrichum galactomycetum TaxID=27317 RepID=A0ACB6V0G7_9ASCO|nr:hypothetical protein D0Z00_003741 [Geotrichum candidum]